MTAKQPTLGTSADYFRFGLETGLLTPDDVRNWADSIIHQMDEPPSAIIDVSLGMSTATLIEALNCVPGERNTSLAGRWLFYLLKDKSPESDEQFQTFVRRATQIAFSTNQGSNLYCLFNFIDDELSLARSNTYGSINEYRAKFEAAIAKYAVTVFHDTP